MSWRTVLSELIKAPAIHWVYAPISAQRTTLPAMDASFEHNRCYVRVRLLRMFLGYRRIWTQERRPVVHAFPRFLQGQGYVEVPVVVGPSKLQDMDGQHLDRVIAVNQTILGPVPYLGGDFQILLALFAAETKNYAEKLLDLLGSLSNLVPATNMTTALGFLRFIEQGLESMLGLGDLTLQVGVQDTFANPAGGSVPNPLRPGYWVLMARDRDDVDPDEIWLTEEGLFLNQNGRPGAPLSGCDYLVFSIERIDSRDWRELPPLTTAWQRTEEAVRTGDRGAIERAFEMFKWTLLGTEDLLPAQRRRVLEEQVTELKGILAAGELGLGGPRGLDKEIPPAVFDLFQDDLLQAAQLGWQS